MRRYLFLGSLCFFIILSIISLLGNLGDSFSLSYSVIGSYFYLDHVGLLFSILSFLLGVSLLFFLGLNSGIVNFFLFMSIAFSILCYFCSHSLLFWGFYEMSILCLLALLVLFSPYSERYIASWYLLGYVVLTSLPMFLCVLYLSLENGCYDLMSWSSCHLSRSSIFCLLVLSLLFITKIPLLPFHVWLPIVHAEATSPVSVCLSGFIMKLGVLGLYRFCSSVLPDYIFSPLYVFLVLVSSFLFFISSCRELDGKRWLAFLSLSHIGIVCFSVCLSDYSLCPLPYYFCLGHGFSAGAIFILLWCVYDLSGSRNWSTLKGLLMSSTVVRVLSVVCLFSAASVPPTITFFSEVLILGNSLASFIFLSVLFSGYLFLSGLIPLFLLGYALGLGVSVSLKSSLVVPYVFSIILLSIWMYFLFFLV